MIAPINFCFYNYDPHTSDIVSFEMTLRKASKYSFCTMGNISGASSSSVGKVDGNRSLVSESIEIKKDASMVGNVKTRRIMIEDGASFKGSIDIEKSSKSVDSNLDNSAARTLSKSA